MPIILNGTGTISGLTAGGLPDGVITTDDIAADAVTSAKIASGAIVNADVNASAAIADSKLTGTTCKAWVNFNGTGTVAIRASYNVSSITDNGAGDYTVNFTTAMPDANYSAVAQCNDRSTQYGTPLVTKLGTQSASSSIVFCEDPFTNVSIKYDPTIMNVAIFR